jgi:hypothetical protein
MTVNEFTHKHRNLLIYLDWCCLILHVSSDLGVQHKDHSSSDSTESVGTSTLEEGSGSLVSDDLFKAVSGSLVNPFRLGLLGLHLQTAADSVHWVRGVSSGNGGELCATELGTGTKDVVLVLLVRIVSRESIEETEVDSTVRNDTGDGNTDSIVKTSNTRGLDGLGQTVDKTVELLLSSSNIRSETSTGVIEGVDNQKGSSSGKTSSSHIDGEKLEEFSVLVGLRENFLDGILEGKVKGLGGEITDDVGHVSTPESLDTLLSRDTAEAVNDTGVTGDLSRDDLGVGILGLDKELDTLDGGSASLGDSTRDTSGHKIDKEISRHCVELLEN